MDLDLELALVFLLLGFLSGAGIVGTAFIAMDIGVRLGGPGPVRDDRAPLPHPTPAPADLARLRLVRRGNTRLGSLLDRDGAGPDRDAWLDALQRPPRS